MISIPAPSHCTLHDFNLKQKVPKEHKQISMYWHCREWIWVSSSTGSNSLHSIDILHPVSLGIKHHFCPRTMVGVKGLSYPSISAAGSSSRTRCCCLSQELVCKQCLFSTTTKQLGDDGIYMAYSRGQVGKTNYKKGA